MPLDITKPMFTRLSSELATLISVFGFVINLQTVNLLVSILAGMVAIVAGCWAIWDKWKKRRVGK